MGNSPSKNDALPNTSTSSSSGQGLTLSASSGTGDLEPDESAPALSQSNNYTKRPETHLQNDGNLKSGGFISSSAPSALTKAISISNSKCISTQDAPSQISNQKSILSESYSDIKKSSNFGGSSPKKIPKNNNIKNKGKYGISKSSSNDADLDLEINLSMARLLTSNNNLSVPDCSNSLDSSSSTLASPVFTTNDTKDEDLLSSFGSTGSPTVSVNGTITNAAFAKPNDGTNFDVSDYYKNLEPIVERSLESTPEPKKASPKKNNLSRQSITKAKAIAKADLDSQVIKRSSSACSSNSSSPPLIPLNSKKSEIDIDLIIDRLLEIGMKKPLGGYSSNSRRSKDKLPITSNEIKYILSKSRSIFLDQPTLLRLSPPVKIVGDIHGQFHDLIRIFNACGYPPYTNYLFLGDYVDRGCKSLETMLLLLCYKIKYPENFFMLRGNHESANITKIYGFYDECKRRLPLITGSHKLWKNFVDVFNTLPIAATINDKIFCIHGGLSPELTNFNQIENIKRPTDIPDKGLLADLLWSDPDSLIKSFSLANWPKNDRGVSYCFGKKHVDYFLSKFNMDLIVRGHMVVEDGYEFFNKRKLVTIFSAPNYCGEFNNYGAVMSVDKALCCSFELLKPQ